MPNIVKYFIYILNFKIFNIFFTSKEKGTGIGLCLAKRFIEASGGSLFLFDRDGGGTTANILLPQYKGAETV